jgi:hypothetical protein
MTEKKDKRGWGRTTPPEETNAIILVGGRELHGKVVDISHTGVLIECEDPPKVGTKLRIDFASGGRGVQVGGLVVRSDRGIAVRLDGVSLEDRMTLDGLIDRALKSKG